MKNPFSILCFMLVGLLSMMACQPELRNLALITGDGVRVRSSPHILDNNDTEIRLTKGETVEIITQSPHTTLLTIKGVQVDKPWFRVSSDKGTGWVYGAYVELLEEEPIALLLPVKYIPPPPSLYRPNVPPKSDKLKDKLADQFQRFWEKNFGGNEQKELIQLLDACDYDEPTVRNVAVRIAGEHSGSLNLGQVCDLYDFARDQWGYVNDPPNKEYVAKASESIINQGNGDCDDYAVLVASLITSIGGEVRISYAYDFNSGHAFSEVLIGMNEEVLGCSKEYLEARYSTNNLPGFRQDKNGWWLNLDWFSDHPGGTYFSYRYGTRFDILRKQFEQL